MKKLLSIALIIFFALSQAVYASPQIKANSAIVASALSGQVVFKKNPDIKINPSSFTKLMVCLVAFEKHGLNQMVLVPNDFESYYGIGLKPNEEITTGDLIKAALISNSDDASVALALYTSKSKAEFVKLMNSKAKQLKMNNTMFTNVTGTKDENQYTTANDLLKLYMQIYNTPELLNILNTYYSEINPTNLSQKRMLYSRNHTINSNNPMYYYPNVDGGFTFTSDGYCSAILNAKVFGTELICVTIDSNLKDSINNALKDSIYLLKDAFGKYSIKTIVKKDAILYEAKVHNAVGTNHTLLYSSSTVKGLILNNDDINKVTKKFNIPNYISAPIKKNSVLGTVDFIYKGETIEKVNLISKDDIMVNPIKYAFSGVILFLNLTPVKTLICIIIAIFALYIASTRASIKKQKRRKRKKNI